MKLPKELSPEQLALDFTMSTVEVERVIRPAADLDKIVVGRVNEITQHPQADKLQVCQVEVGPAHPLQIVCGGINLTKDMLVAVALVGARVRWHGQGELVPLEKAKIRGIDSDGMIAAAAEIGLAELFPARSEREILDLSGWGLKVGQSLSQALGRNDIILDIDNKSINHRPDLWGQYGLARELAAIYRTKLKDYSALDIKIAARDIKLSVTVADPDNCYRYTALAISGVKVQDSPWWLKNALQAVGIRPINNIVDVTNYVMYELGQPLHAFDAREINDHHIVVKTAKKGESFVTLDAKKRKLPEGALMIADSQKYVALAGIMGGQNSEISPDTTEIIIESANFRAASIRRTSLALGLRSESSARFEKSLDPALTELALKKSTEMILALNPGAQVASEVVDINHNHFKPITLTVEESLINRQFGSVIPAKEIRDILERLQFSVTHKAKKFEIQVPTWRATKDISIPEDIVEEVARIYGYDNIQDRLPLVALREPIYDVAYHTEKELKNWLAGAQAYTEIFSYAFTDILWAQKLGMKISEHIQVKNPVSPEQAYLNLSLLPNLLKKAEANLRWFEEFRIFELQRIFDKRHKGVYPADQTARKFLPHQPKFLAGLALTRQGDEAAFLNLKGLMEAARDFLNIDWQSEKIDLPYAGLAYQIKFQDLVLGHYGLLNPDLFDSGSWPVSVTFWQIDFDILIKYINDNRSYRAWPKFPAIKRDMAVIVDQKVSWQDLETEIYKISPLIRRLEPFDVFKDKSLGSGKKSIAYHLEFRSDDRTLSSEEIDDLMKNIVANLKKKFNATLR